MDSRVSTYHRIMQSEKAIQILSNSKINLNTKKLRTLFIGNSIPKNSNLYKFMKNASQNSGFISSEYHFKDIVTARMFNSKHSLNLITLHEREILEAMNSRYENGFMVVMDYKHFEPSIIKHLLGDVFPDDYHSWAFNLLNIPHNDVKKVNMELLYCQDFNKKVIEKTQWFLDIGIPRENVSIYISQLILIRETISSYVESHLKTYNSKGFVVNSYGRKIYPKSSHNIFNNIIQSIGSEILAEAIINLNDYLEGKECHILFHRFDSLYFDISKKELLKSLSGLQKIMTTSGGDIKLEVKIQLGENLISLKEL